MTEPHPVDSWLPPEGMLPSVAREWRAFYRRAFTQYGISPGDYRALYLAQLGRCYICQIARGVHPDDPKGKGGRRLGVDHNHLITGRASVRGLLCTGSFSADTCNRMIARYSYEALQRAVDYVQRAPAQQVFYAVDMATEWTDEELTGSAYLG
jgi:hypothetical protein